MSAGETASAFSAVKLSVNSALMALQLVIAGERKPAIAAFVFLVDGFDVDIQIASTGKIESATQRAHEL